MKKLSTIEIRKKFVEYFEKNDHLKISGSSLIPQNDPSILYVVAGMAPLKKYFLGQDTPTCPRLVNYQACIRTKDIDDVGDRHHLTFFEMLGSWSIGDYYKEKAVELAYGLLVDGLGFDPKRLWVTVYEGNEKLGIPADEVSYEAWKKVGMDESRIVRLGEDNFWAAGDTGPCGPCTEVFFDCGEEYGPAFQHRPGEEFDTTKRYIEIWNAGVFMEYEGQEDGTVKPLPVKSVDTGSGLERMAMIMNGHESVYDTDCLKPILDLIHVTYPGLDPHTERMMTDHLRASIMILAEGVSPGQEGRGYIPRRLLRKCISALVSAKINQIDFAPFVNKVDELLGEFYPQLQSNKEFILHQLKQEIDEFLPVVKKGLEKIDQEVKGLKNKVFPGKVAFDLVTTHGLPLEVIHTDLKGRGIELDEKAYNEAWEKHKSVSRVLKSSTGEETSLDVLERLFSKTNPTKFSGYEKLEDSSKVIHLLKGSEEIDEAQVGAYISFVTEISPFYGESGGQAGDIGMAHGDGFKVEISDTKKIHGCHLHMGNVTEGTIKKGATINLQVSKDNRLITRRNHSATHLLHAALHKVIGKHALQKGSSVSSERLRFDFQHTKAVTDQEIETIENLVNDWIYADHSGDIRILPYKEALQHGALALFGENYGDEVRVIAFGEDSVELCGGTHVDRTGEIGAFVITQESSVAKGIRRIEAITGTKAQRFIQERIKVLKESAKLLGVGPVKLKEGIENLKKKSAGAKKAPKETVKAEGLKFDEEKTLVFGGSKKFFLGRIDKDKDFLKDIGDQIMDKGETDVVSLVGVSENSVRAFVWVNKDLMKKVKAGDLLKKLLVPIEGKGGGRPNFAQGGGPNTQDVPKIFELVGNDSFKSWLEDGLN